MGMEQVRHAAGNWKRLIQGGIHKAKRAVQSAVTKTKHAFKTDRPISNAGASASAEQVFTRNRVNKAREELNERGRANRRTAAKVGAAGLGVAGLAAGGLALARRAKQANEPISKLRGLASKAASKIKSLSHRQKAAIGAGAASAGGLMLMRRSRRKNKR